MGFLTLCSKNVIRKNLEITEEPASTELKLVTEIIIFKINNNLIELEDQPGFNNGRLCTGAILIICQINDKTLESN